MRKKLFDPHCRDLAEYFLTDTSLETTDDLDALAGEIQQVIEDYINAREPDASAALNAEAAADDALYDKLRGV